MSREPRAKEASCVSYLIWPYPARQRSPLFLLVGRLERNTTCNCSISYRSCPNYVSMSQIAFSCKTFFKSYFLNNFGDLVKFDFAFV